MQSVQKRNRQALSSRNGTQGPDGFFGSYNSRASSASDRRGKHEREERLHWACGPWRSPVERGRRQRTANAPAAGQKAAGCTEPGAEIMETRPDMQRAQGHDSQAAGMIDRSLQAQLGRQLRANFEGIEEEPVPERFVNCSRRSRRGRSNGEHSLRPPQASAVGADPQFARLCGVAVRRRGARRRSRSRKRY